MMKRIAYLLICAMIVFISACGKGGETTASRTAGEDTGATKTEAPSTTEAPADTKATKTESQTETKEPVSETTAKEAETVKPVPEAPDSAVKPIEEAKVGDYIEFGYYEQDGNLENGPEILRWRVLDETENLLLLISEKVLDQQMFFKRRTIVNWADSDIRNWLVFTFRNEVFRNDDILRINMVENVNVNKSDIKTVYEANTWDSVFLLSEEEAERYFKDDEDRKCAPTPYAVSRGVAAHEQTGGSCWWWLRTTAEMTMLSAVSCVDAQGYVGVSSQEPNFPCVGVRPAVWLTKKAPDFIGAQ